MISSQDSIWFTIFFQRTQNWLSTLIIQTVWFKQLMMSNSEVLELIDWALIIHGNAATWEQGQKCWKIALELRKNNICKYGSTCVDVVNAISK
jgi:hypothetical protein